jgi:replicative DNA helicase
VCEDTGLDYKAIARGGLSDEEWNIFDRSYSKLRPLVLNKIVIGDPSDLNIPQLVSRSQRLSYGRHGLSIVFIDYLQLMSSEYRNRDRVAEVSEISRGHKKLARALNIPVVSTAQLSRNLESRLNKRPILSDLRDSGAIEQDADVVVFIYRDDYYNGDDSERPNIAELNVAKNRNGPTGVAEAFWHGKHPAPIVI